MVWLPFGKRQDQDYESVLVTLETQIKARETQLLSIKLRERRATVLALTYGIGACAVYAVLWYFGVVGKGQGVERLAGALPLVVGPVFVIFARRILGAWFHRQENREEKVLRALKKQQRDKIEELKKKTGYYSTRNLLEKYDDAIKRGAEGRPGQVRPGGPSQPGTPQSAKGVAQTGTPVTPTRKGPHVPGAPATGTPQQQQHLANLPLLPPAASTPPRRTWLDRVADALLGVQDEASPNSKYALICQKCFVHNGLVPKEEFDSIQYTCPRCGHFNPRRERKDETDSGGLSRRSKSLHVPSSSKLSQSLDAHDQEPEAVLMEEKAKDQPAIRQRASKTDAMEVDG